VGLIRDQAWNFPGVLVGEFRLRSFDDIHLTSGSLKDPSALLFTMDNEQPGVLGQYSELSGELGAS
jgi:hypothetical protein